MKKVIALILVLILCLSLCACGASEEVEVEKALSVEEMIAQATWIKLDELQYEMRNNMVRAETQYKGKLVKIKNITVERIDSFESHAAVKMTYWPQGGYPLTLTIKLPKEEAATLNNGNVITVVGTLNFSTESFADLNDAHLIS